MKNVRMKVLAMVAVVLAGNAISRADVPKGWVLAGSQPKEYQASVDRQVVHGNKASASLKSIAPNPSGFGTMMQTVQADSFLGKRVRFSGYVRADGVTDWAGFWMRVDGQTGEPLAFDNMQNRPVKGSSNWKKCEIVLDVPESAKEIAYGLLLSGAGQVWMSDLNLEVVNPTTPTTSSELAAPPGPLPAPQLDFGEK